MSPSENEAGPSTAPIFKKKGNRGQLLAKKVEAATTEEDGNAPSGVNDSEISADSHELSISLDDLVKLRSSRNRPSGIDLESLNKGSSIEKKKRKKTGSDQKTKEELWEEQMNRGGLVNQDSVRGANVGMNDEEDKEEGTTKDGAPLLIRQNNFQGERANIDVDKHMMAYIEEEMRKRRLKESTGDSVLDQHNVSANEQDQLFNMSEKYKRIQQSALDAIAREKARINADPNEADHDQGFKREKDEGNAALSTSMLTSVPEIDLGMEHRMRNIEATEKARRMMNNANHVGTADRNEGVDDDTDYASARFFKSNRNQVDIEQIYAEIQEEDSNNSNDEELQPPEPKRRETATDDMVLGRFKMRQRNRLK